MNTQYKVLVCDDDKAWYESIQPRIQSTIRKSTSLIPVVTYVKSPKEIRDRNLNEYDLFLVDYNFKENETGADIINLIRTNKVYTSVVFYSAQQDTRDVMKDLALEGVYSSNRDRETLLDKIKVVSQLSIKRLLDPNSLRGLFLTTVAEIEQKMDALLIHAHNQLVEACADKIQVRDFVKATLKGMLQSANANLKKLEQQSLDFNEMLAKRGFVDLYKKNQLLKDIIGHEMIKGRFQSAFKKHGIGQAKDLYKLIDEEIRLFRNELAHEPEGRLFNHMSEQVSKLDGNSERKKQMFQGHKSMDFSDESFKYLHYIVCLGQEYNSLMDDLIDALKLPET